MSSRSNENVIDDEMIESLRNDLVSCRRELAESRLRYCSNGTFHSRHYEKTARDMSRVARAPLRVLPLAV